MRAVFLTAIMLIGCDDGSGGDPMNPIPDAGVDGAVVDMAAPPPPPAALDAAARACEVIFTDPSGAVQVTFGPGVRGRSLTQQPRTAVAFIATSDLPFGPDAITVDGPVEVLDARCFDAAGQLIPTATVEL
jgi:hypothetical protein